MTLEWSGILVLFHGPSRGAITDLWGWFCCFLPWGVMVSNDPLWRKGGRQFSLHAVQDQETVITLLFITRVPQPVLCTPTAREAGKQSQLLAISREGPGVWHYRNKGSRRCGITRDPSQTPLNEGTTQQPAICFKASDREDVRKVTHKRYRGC